MNRTLYNFTVINVRGEKVFEISSRINNSLLYDFMMILKGSSFVFFLETADGSVQFFPTGLLAFEEVGDESEVWLCMDHKPIAKTENDSVILNEVDPGKLYKI